MILLQWSARRASRVGHPTAMPANAPSPTCGQLQHKQEGSLQPLTTVQLVTKQASMVLQSRQKRLQGRMGEKQAAVRATCGAHMPAQSKTPVKHSAQSMTPALQGAFHTRTPAAAGAAHRVDQRGLRRDLSCLCLVPGHMLQLMLCVGTYRTAPLRRSVCTDPLLQLGSPTGTSTVRQRGIPCPLTC